LNRKITGSWLFTGILVISLALNLFLAIKYTDLAKRQNTMWRNAITHLTQVINWVSISNGDLSKRRNDSTYRLDEIRTNLRLLQQQLENTGTLPFADQIFPWKQREKLRNFINYNYEVVRIIEQELKDEGTVSAGNKERVEVIHNTWEEILRVLETERNKRSPFSPIFTPTLWSSVFEKTLAVFDGVELIPLPEKGKQ